MVVSVILDVTARHTYQASIELRGAPLLDYGWERCLPPSQGSDSVHSDSGGLENGRTNVVAQRYSPISGGQIHRFRANLSGKSIDFTVNVIAVQLAARLANSFVH
jgi:hypothetical protein